MKNLLLGATALGLALQAGHARADADMSAASFAAADIIVTAALEKRQLQALATPSFGVAIAEDQLQAINAVNVEDLLRYAPATIVRKRYAGDPNATLSFRNMHSQQTARALVVVDGFVISNFLGASWDTAPKWGVLAPDDVARVEVIYGPTSARYAGNSLGGTLLLQTRPITTTALRAEAQLFGQDYRYYQTDADLFGWSLDAGLDYAIDARGGLSLSYRHFQNRGQPQEWRMVNAGTPYADQALVDPELPFLRIAAQDSAVESTQDQIRLRGQYELAGGWKLHGLAALLLAQDETLHPQSFLRDAQGLPSFVGITGVNAGVTQRSELLTGIGLAGHVHGWALDLSYSRFDTLRDRSRTSDNFDLLTGQAPRSGRYRHGRAAWQNAEARAERAIGAHDLALGLSLAQYRDDSHTRNLADWRYGMPMATSASLRDAAGGRTLLLGAFVEDEIALGDKLGMTLGLRHESWRASGGYLSDSTQSLRYPGRRHSAWSPKAALTFRPDAASSITASLALATRFPTVRELYQPGLVQYGANVGELDLNGFNPDLKPEKAVDVQLTAMRRFEHVHVTLDVYRQDVRDSIFAQTIAIPDAQTGDLTQTSLVTNIGKVRSWGADLVLTAEDILLPGLALDANLSWIDARITRNPLNPALVGNHFPRVPQWRLNASLRYAPDHNWDLALNFRQQSVPDRNLENDATSKCSTFFCVTDFAFVDLKAARRLGNFTLSLGIDNLFDQKAFVYHPYPGRSFLLALKWNGGR